MRRIVVVFVVGGLAVAGVAMGKHLNGDESDARSEPAMTTYTLTDKDGEKTVCEGNGEYSLCSRVGWIGDGDGDNCGKPPFPACDALRANGRLEIVVPRKNRR